MKLPRFFIHSCGKFSDCRYVKVRKDLTTVMVDYDGEDRDFYYKWIDLDYCLKQVELDIWREIKEEEAVLL